jgi:hydroxylamine dehydrogenase
MGPDYTHWHGTYEVAKHFYAEFIPELEELISTGRKSDDAARTAAAETLAKKLEEVLATPNHQWYLDRLDPAEKERRKLQMEEFQKRYAK